MKEKKCIAIIDGYHLLHRGYYGPLKQGFKTRNKEGQLVNALFVFASRILKLLKSNNYWSVIVAFDVSGDCWRRELWEKYKATRKETPEDLKPQMQLARKFLTASNIPWYEKNSYEGEDVIATVAKKAVAEGFTIDVFTNDKDLFQIVTEEVNVIVQKDKKTPPKRITPDVVREEFGIEPYQIADMKSLLGDNSDNIKGVSGLKYAQAISLINKFDIAENIVKSLDEMKPNLRNKIEASSEKILINKKITTICNDIDIGHIDLSEVNVNYIGFMHYLNSNGMFSLNKKLNEDFQKQVERLKSMKFEYKKNK